MYRLKNLLVAVAVFALALVGAVIALSVTYLLSDVAYSIGVWPIGALLRITFWGEALGAIFLVLALLFNVAVSPFRPEDSA